MIATYYRPEAHHHGERHTCPVCLRAMPDGTLRYFMESVLQELDAQ